MKICHIVPSLESQHGGPSRSALGLARALARHGHNTTLLATTSGDAGVLHEGALSIRRFLRTVPQSICASRDMRDWLRKQQFDLIHHHGLWLRTLHYAHSHARDSARTRFIVSPRGMMTPWAWRHHRTRKYWAERLVHPKAFTAVDAWHATSEEEGKEIRALGFRQPVWVSPNAVELPTEESLHLARQHWFTICPEIKNRRIALFYSRFHQKKRLRELIELWGNVARDTDWSLLIVGIPEAYSVAQLRAEAPADGSIHIYSGEASPPPYAVASLFLLPSHSENFGLVIAEAMAHRVPALVTDGTPWQTLAEHDAGWCVAWKDYQAQLATCLRETPEGLLRKGEAAATWMARDFTWKKSARILSGFYQQLSDS